MSADALVMRRARRADLARIVALYADDIMGAARETLASAGGALAPGYLTAFAHIDGDANNELIVAELDGEVVGSCQLTFIWHLSHGGSRVMQIEAVRIDAARRGRKLGARMIEWAIGRARAAECRVVQLTSNVKRVDARRFYERLGFVASHAGFKLTL
ncbi:MAG TPA: GNAT family N-acetyltransferase [Polyangia bacterium]|nr:GNAT family N-acetyltransferase [Polyangia bacterium]